MDTLNLSLNCSGRLAVFFFPKMLLLKEKRPFKNIVSRVIRIFFPSMASLLRQVQR